MVSSSVNCLEARLLGVFGIGLEFDFPAFEASLSSVVFGFVLVASFHPNPGETCLDVDVVWIQLEGRFTGAEGFVEFSQVEVDFGFCEPGVEALLFKADGLLKESERLGVITDCELKRGLIDNLSRGGF